MILVQPLLLGTVEQRKIEPRGIEGAKSQGLESQPAAELVLALRNAKKQILVPYAVLPLAVDTRLVRNDHTAHQRLRIKVLAHILRPFVHTQERAHAVPGAMPEVTLEAPQRFAGKSIDTAA